MRAIARCGRIAITHLSFATTSVPMSGAIKQGQGLSTLSLLTPFVIRPVMHTVFLYSVCSDNSLGLPT